jgi:hypothetical protein
MIYGPPDPEICRACRVKSLKNQGGSFPQAGGVLAPRVIHFFNAKGAPDRTASRYRTQGSRQP